ncbi:MAG: L-histidine N(alpha)-methyltransferase [Deltaproteobacteria bacterium]|nr:L-histidine N(alpha)-methyltransferase [Deltaproteobacteria bacterium]
MNTNRTSDSDRFRLTVHKFEVGPPSFSDEVRAGLSNADKSLPCRFFYDDLGSKIFEEICDLEEYYLTRVERGILIDRAVELAKRFDEDVALVELGSGSAEKTRILIEALLDRQKSLVYIPIAPPSKKAAEHCYSIIPGSMSRPSRASTRSHSRPCEKTGRHPG